MTENLPIGSVIMWHGKEEDIPKGWVICNTKNSKISDEIPDLSGRFVVGAGQRKEKNSNGQSAKDYSYGKPGGNDSITLTTSELPSHKHTINSGGEHRHAYDLRTKDMNCSFDRDDSGRHVAHWCGSYEQHTKHEGEHSHSMEETGDGKAFEISPPYYALYFIKHVRTSLWVEVQS